MALPSYLYGDPLAQLIAKENRTCKGCKYLEAWLVFGETKEFCKLKRRNMKKCVRYDQANKEVDK